MLVVRDDPKIERRRAVPDLHRGLLFGRLLVEGTVLMKVAQQRGRGPGRFIEFAVDHHGRVDPRRSDDRSFRWRSARHLKQKESNHYS